MRQLFLSTLASLLAAPLAWPQSLPVITVKNRSSLDRLQWVKAGVPFPRGQIKGQQDLDRIVADPLAELVPLKWHYEAGRRHSVAIARLITLVQLKPAEEQRIPLRYGARFRSPFSFGANTLLWLAQLTPFGFFVTAKFQSDPKVHLATFLGNLRILDFSERSLTLRMRNNLLPIGGGAEHALSFTTYMTFDANQDFGELVMLIGNDTYEKPVSGGIDLEYVDLYYRRPFTVDVRSPRSYGLAAAESLSGGYVRQRLLAAANIADGSAVPFRGSWGVVVDKSSLNGRSYTASVTDPLHGIADFKSWQSSLAAGSTGVLIDRRFPNLDAGRRAVAGDCGYAPVAGPFDSLGGINQAPFFTGDQPDFSSNVPIAYLQTVQTNSACPLEKAVMRATRESLRPSFYFMNRNGLKDRIRWSDFPELFFWSGRPHFGCSWNAEYPGWKSRSTACSGFRIGDTHGWASMDNQHYSHNHLRMVWELTGDPYIKDLLVYYQSVILWNHLNKKILSDPEAERTGRLYKEGVLIYMVDDESRAAAVLKSRLIQKNMVAQKAEVDSKLRQYGHAGIKGFKNDARCKPWCTGYRVAVGWQTGFHMEFQALMLKMGWDVTTAGYIADRYLNDIAFYWLASGKPKTYIRYRQPSQYSTGGVDRSWWSGWIEMASRRQTHPSWPFVRDTIIPVMRQHMTPAPGTYWHQGDKWRNFK
ncbi:MAG: hypothetical protein ACE5F1_01250 [Planctomycetota bacterium]